MAKKHFKFSSKPVTNPYIGFTTFQHFRNDSLYSDIVVRPENNFTETEERECYPVPIHTEHRGYEEGFYPDCRVAYIRILWKEFEPQRGQYNYALIEDILNKARANKQTVMFRLMPHSTRETDDVPDWLKELIPCPKRPKGERVKESPSDPVYLKYLGAAIEKIGERFDGNPTLDLMDISLTGAWGEGSGLENYPQEALEELIDIYTRSFKHTLLIGQGIAPWLINHGCKTVPIGWRGDGVGGKAHVNEVYSRANTALGDLWKTAPAVFESYWWLCEWERQGWNIDDIIEMTLSWHISNFNAKFMPVPHKWKDKIDYWLSKMGYHFAIKTLEYQKTVQAGGDIELTLSLENRGVAPIYRLIPVKIRIKNDKDSYVFDSEIDIRKWLPGEITEHIKISLPPSISKGVYDLEIGIFKDDVLIQLETDTKKDGNYYFLTTFSIT